MTEGEVHLIRFLDLNLKKDDSFNAEADLTKYNGWLIFVQPFLNGSRPDMIIFNPNIGVQIIEVKDWDLLNYKFEKNKLGKVDLFVSNGKGSYPIKSPVTQVENGKK